MFSKEVFVNVLLMLLCHVYILFIIFVSSRIDKLLHISQKASRKFLHAMIGNLPFLIPFFTSNFYPVLVAAPFILVTFFVSPYSPLKNISKGLKGLADMTLIGNGTITNANKPTKDIEKEIRKSLSFWFPSSPENSA